MRILQIVSGKNVNGAVKHCLDLSLALQDRGNEVHVACRPGSWIAKQLAESKVAVIESDLNRFPKDDLNHVAAYLKKHQIEAVHTHMSRAHFFGVLLKWITGVPCVASAHCRQLQLHWTFNDYVIAVSDATRKFHQKVNRVRARKIETIYNFTELPQRKDNAATVQRKKGRLLAKNNLPDDCKLITFVGGLEKRKGLKHLFEAMPAVVQANPDAQLLIVGEQVKKKRERRYMELAKQRADEMGVADRIHYLGFRSDVHEILALSDVFVLPSLEESFPLTILEAMSVRVPVVATDVGGVGECVADGINGFVVPAKQPQRLAQSLIKILSDPQLATEMGALGRQWVEDNYGIDQQLAKIENVFARVVKKADGQADRKLRAA